MFPCVSANGEYLNEAITSRSHLKEVAPTINLLALHNKLYGSILEDLVAPPLRNMQLDQGYEIVPISQLIYKDNYHMDHTGRQISDSK